jgi:hypothetical protein
MTSTLACISGSPATSNTINMVVNPILPVSVIVAPDQNNVCQGTTVTFTATPINGGSPTYQWYKNTLPVGVNQSTYTFVPLNGDQVYVVMTSNLSCLSGSPATSNVVTMSVNAPLPVSVNIAPNQNNVCQGASVVMTATPTNGGTPAYQWYKNTLPVGLNQSTYAFTPANGDQVYVVMTSGLSCVSGNPATSNTIAMIVNPILPAGVSIAASQNNICQGTTVTYTATPSNGGTPVYQWYVNNLPVGLNQSTYTNVPANGDQVKVVMTSTLPCISGSPATSNVINMVVNPILPVSVSIVPDQNIVCQGTTVTFTATPINGGIPTYQWYKNTLPVGLNQSTYTDVPVNGDQVYVMMTSNLLCISGSPATSNAVTMVVNAPLPVGVSIFPDQNNVCLGTLVTFTATPANGGAASFQWFVNGIPFGNNQPVFSYFPANGDQVHVVMTSSLTCVTGNPATSNTVSMIVNTPLQAGVSITASQNNVCQGTSVTFTATPVNGGTPVYQWYQNALPVGANQPTYTVVPADGDQVSVLMTSSLSCISGSPAASNTVTMVVVSLPGNAGIIIGSPSVCDGDDQIPYSVAPVANATSYQWTVPAGAVIISGGGTANIIVNFATGASSGAISVMGLNSCGNGGVSPDFQVTVNPIPTTPVVTAVGPDFTSSAPAGNQWFFQGSLIPGATGQTYNASQPGWYWTVVTLNGCTSDTSNHSYLAGVGLDDQTIYTSFTVYPVPNDGRFTISVVVPSAGKYDILIFNAVGKQIFELRDLLIRDVFERTIDLRPLSDGLYPVLLKNSNGSVVRWVLVHK